VKRTFEVLNELEQQGVFTRYAIGGAMAATFYPEPFLTFDLDVFVFRYLSCSGAVSASEPEASAVTDRRYNETLRARGYTEENECVLIEGVPVQFLPAYNSLVEEALNQAQEIMYEDVQARVLRSEHLVAISLQTGRGTDRERVRSLREQAQLDTNFLAEILRRHELEEKWKLWTEQEGR
jgi:hypothetical protein